MFEHIKAPAIVGAVLTALAGVLTAISTIPAVALYATFGVSLVNTALPLFSFTPGLATFRVPALVGVLLTGVAAVLAGLQDVSAVAIYATAAAGAIHAITPLFRFDSKLKGTTAGERMAPKVEVPAWVGTCVTAALVVLSLLAGVPAVVPYATGGLTFLHTVAGYFVYAD